MTCKPQFSSFAQGHTGRAMPTLGTLSGRKLAKYFRSRYLLLPMLVVL